MQRAPRLLAVEGGTVSVAVRESARAKRLRVTVRPRRRVEAVVPRRITDRQLDHFLTEHRDWIERKLRELPEPRLGLDCPGVAWVGLQPRIAPAGDLERWYRQEARRRIGEVAARVSA